MQLVTYLAGTLPHLGAVWHDTLLDLPAVAADMAAQRTGRPGRGDLLPASMLGLIDGGPDVWARAHEAWDYGRALVDRLDPDDLRRRRLARPLGRTRLLAPIPRPRKNVYCMGRNYAEHAAERGAAPPERPVFFTKPPTAVIGPGVPIVHHAITRALDYEVELAVVVGLPGRDFSREEALAHVFGYTVLNDVTARDLQKAHQQWFKGKSLDSFCPMGPGLVTADEIPDPQALGIRLRVNGVVRQEATTAQMIFGVADLLAALASGMTLEAGDILATGTPSGVGAATGAYLKPGDVVEAEIDGLGCLTNPVRGPGEAA